MKLDHLLTALTLSITLAAGSVQAGFIPFGQVAGVSQATLDSWGWTEIHRSSAAISTSEADIIAAATGDYLMMGIWDSTNNVYAILGAGETSVVTAVTTTTSYSGPAALNNWSNGINFYRTANAPSYGSWGFTNLDYVYQNAADIHLFDGISYPTETLNGVPTLATGLSMHNISGSLYPGWSYNVTGTNQVYLSSNMQRVFFTTNSSPVPEAASTFALLSLAAVGLSIRRRKV